MTPEQALAEEMVESHRGMVCKIAMELSPGAFVDLEDLIQEGYIGLLGALSRFDETKEVKFSTYASYRIKGRIRDYLRSLDHLDRTHREKLRDAEASDRPLAPISVDMSEWANAFAVSDDYSALEDGDVIRDFIEWSETNGRLSDKHRGVLALLLDGHSQLTIAEMVGLTPSRVSQMIKKVTKEAREYGRIHHATAA